jgi:hypothetical protein
MGEGKERKKITTKTPPDPNHVTKVAYNPKQRLIDRLLPILNVQVVSRS